jgi:hypothetical protein
MKSFKQQKYLVIRKAVPLNLIDFIYHYFNLKRNVASYLLGKRLISPFEKAYGEFNDTQIPGTYSCYADLVMETLGAGLKSKIEKATELKLIETYTYARIYKHGDVLNRHKDRAACAVSATLCLGGDQVWPIYVDPTGKRGGKGISIKLKPGDLLCYSGCEIEHWREAFMGKDCGQVFLHYNDLADKSCVKYDGRPALGLPAYVKNYK